MPAHNQPHIPVFVKRVQQLSVVPQTRDFRLVVCIRHLIRNQGFVDENDVGLERTRVQLGSDPVELVSSDDPVLAHVFQVSWEEEVTLFILVFVFVLHVQFLYSGCIVF